jgi:hypothetical protein
VAKRFFSNPLSHESFE